MTGWLPQGEAGLAVGILAGFVSGLLGVSPGGILVPVTIILTGCEQHVAQAVSLVCQIAPTSLGAIRRYRQQDGSIRMQWVLMLLAGFLAGEIAGSFGSSQVSASALQWTYVGYLVLLLVLLMVRSRQREHRDGSSSAIAAISSPGLLLVGSIAGFSSGFLGIGGGLAIVVGLSGLLKVPQRQAQAVSLLLSIFPMTAPAAFIYWRQGWPIPWVLSLAVIAGLFFGNDLGARLAVRLPTRRLQQSLAGLVFIFAVYMAFKAMGIA